MILFFSRDTSLRRISVDKKAVRQIVFNILSYSIKYTLPGGEISVVVGSTSPVSQYVSIYDNSAGISDDYIISEIVSPLKWPKYPTKDYDWGDALLLKTAKQIVELHGGNFQLR